MIMATITLEYNPNNDLARSIIESVKSAGVFTVAEETSPYDKEFVELINESRRSAGKVIKTDDLWK